MKSQRILLGGMLVLVFASCKKHETVPAPDNPTQAVEISQLQQEYVANHTQSFTVDANSIYTITGEKGTELYLDGTNFTDLNGNTLTGNVTIQLVEIYSPIDMVLMNKVTLGNNNGQNSLLSSGGEFKITVTQNGNPIRIENDIQITTAPSQNLSSNMELFGADENVKGDVFWQPLNQNVQIDTSTFQYNCSLDTSYQWINCDYFYASSAQTSVTVNVPVACSANNSAVYMTFPDEVAATMGSFSAAGVCGTQAWYQLPVGLNVFFVVITLQNGQLEYAVQQSIIVPNHNETISAQSFTPINSLEDLQPILASLL